MDTDLTVHLNSNGEYDFDNDYFKFEDNWTVLSSDISQTKFTCEDLGKNTVTWSAEDQDGNQSSGSFKVTVKDVCYPTLKTFKKNYCDQ